MSEAVVFWNREPPTSAGWWWHTFTVDPTDIAAIEVREGDNGSLYVFADNYDNRRGGAVPVPVSQYAGPFSRWWPMQLLPPAWPENNP